MPHKRKINRRKKLVRVLKRKLLKPMLYAIAVSLVIYFGISSIIVSKRVVTPNPPRFLISRLSDKFDETEFMHLLLTIQEINTIPKTSAELIKFANGPYPGRCPAFLEKQLNRLNWAPDAFLIRVKKLFEMYEIYDHLIRMDETIAFLSEEIKQEHLPYEFSSQIEVLQQQRDKIANDNLTPEEYNFIKEYHGLVLRLKQL